ncbi:hypothetical protein Enr13x_07610 [Stieleria neptunia]|uniref:Uncharacterized protein n=1 Tax=Stieleria neptunia TaxID=2527979 RepID=A0A518HJB9_9BACT|nr:hypothetical protein [Stieleria neptunia]QDV40923.1 hypothetical protein Enr13x_07610 [Stieleria neptunia]
MQDWRQLLADSLPLRSSHSIDVRCRGDETAISKRVSLRAEVADTEASHRCGEASPGGRHRNDKGNVLAHAELING